MLDEITISIRSQNKESDKIKLQNIIYMVEHIRKENARVEPLYHICIVYAKTAIDLE